MKTSVELDDEKVALAKKLSGTDTLRKLLDEALDAYIAKTRRDSMIDLLGTGFYEGQSKTLRVPRGRSR